MFLVSASFPDVTQQIHSLRASGVVSSHVASAFGVDARASFKSAGSLCIVGIPSEIPFLVIRLFYQILRNYLTYLLLLYKTIYLYCKTINKMLS